MQRNEPVRFSMSCRLTDLWNLPMRRVWIASAMQLLPNVGVK